MERFPRIDLATNQYRTSLANEMNTKPFSRVFFSQRAVFWPKFPGTQGIVSFALK